LPRPIFGRGFKKPTFKTMKKEIELLHEWHDLLIKFLKKEGWCSSNLRKWDYCINGNELELPTISLHNPPKIDAANSTLNGCLQNYLTVNKFFEGIAPIKALNRPIIWAMFAFYEGKFEDPRIPFIYAFNDVQTVVCRHSGYFSECQSLTASQFLNQKLISNLTK